MPPPLQTSGRPDRAPAPRLWARRRFSRRSLVGALLLALASVPLLFPSRSCADEFRGLWVDAFHPGFRTADEIRELVTDARQAHFNALLVEVRKRGDAYYESRFEPKASDIDPAFDPLAELLAQAHDTNAGPRLEVHAWIVAFNIWNLKSTLPPQPDHPYRLHPDWLTQSADGATWDGSNYGFDPGHPAVQEHTCQVAMDLIERYDIDGLHWDYVRYAGREWGYNPAAVARFNEAAGRSGRPGVDDPAWLQWRRDQVTAVVRRVYVSALARKPTVKLSAATITWAPGPTNEAQWFATAPYARVLQDWRSWMQEGILDLNIPMAYFRQERYGADWTNWSAFAKDHRGQRHVALGVGAYLNAPSNSLAQMRSTRSGTATAPPADGLVGYCYAALGRDGLARRAFFEALTQPTPHETNTTPLFADPARPPSLPWKTSHRPTAVMGFVRDAQSGRTIERATIELRGVEAAPLRTDANGFYGMFVGAGSTHTVHVSAAGFASEVRDVELQPGEVTAADFALSPLPSVLAAASALPEASTNPPPVWWPHRPTAGQPLCDPAGQSARDGPPTATEPLNSPPDSSP